MKTSIKYNSTLKDTSGPDMERAFSMKAFIVLLVALIYGMSASAQCAGAPSLVLTNPVLMSGTDLQVGATYRFYNAAPGLDVEVTVIGLNNGAALHEMDNTSQGYGDAWQPYVTAAANDTSSLDWKIVFKKAGTDTDTILPCLAITAIDIDGDSQYLNEFIKASTPGAYAIDPFSLLTVTYDGVRTTATGPLSTVLNIDTTHREVMFQMNFQNVNTIIYRNGSISRKGSDDVRHTCIYFKSFFDTYVLLPVKLTMFSGTNTKDKTQLIWDIEEEKNMESYVIQYSKDGKLFKDIASIPSTNSSIKKRYHAELAKQTDAKGYYRLAQIEKNGRKSFSKTIVLTIDNSMSISCNTIATSSLSIKVNTDKQSQLKLMLYSQNGQLIQSENRITNKGFNEWNVPTSKAKNGLYLLSIRDTSGQIVYSDKIIVTGRN
jgi:hypothetical protein